MLLLDNRQGLEDIDYPVVSTVFENIDHKMDRQEHQLVLMLSLETIVEFL